ncbi:MAG: hypothetical protein U0359_20180 [Byssovorax sp.]
MQAHVTLRILAAPSVLPVAPESARPAPFSRQARSTPIAEQAIAFLLLAASAAPPALLAWITLG